MKWFNCVETIAILVCNQISSNSFKNEIIDKLISLHKNVSSNIEQVLAATPHKAPIIGPPAFPSQKLSKLNEPDTQDTAREAGTRS